ncbi:hypothetical protein BLOT_014369 [Blomia tropicalis]|nr:hypothetical protein BLOT_014369 [Blomia tropicalis]
MVISKCIALHLPIVRMNAYTINGIPIYTMDCLYYCTSQTYQSFVINAQNLTISNRLKLYLTLYNLLFLSYMRFCDNKFQKHIVKSIKLEILPVFQYFPIEIHYIQYSYSHFHRMALHLPNVRINAF